MIARTRHLTLPGRRAAVTTLAVVGLAACAAPQPAPPPPPAPRPVASPAPRPPAPAPADWRDAPQTPGNWTWSAAGGVSAARFAMPGGALLAQLVCDRPRGRVILMRSGSAAAAVPMAVRTTFVTRPLASDPALGGAQWLAAALPARDPLLDAIAFSRGRFAVEAAGLDTLYLPSWPELSRVIEDCR